MALHDHPRIGSATRERVKAFATQMGYRPDPALSALAEYRRNRRPPSDYGTLAYIDPWPEMTTHPDLAWHYAPNSLHMQMLEGARHRAEELGYHLDVFRVDANAANQRALARAFAWRGIRGILIEDMPSEPFPLKLNWADLSAIALLKAPPQQKQIHVVGADNTLQVRVALEALERLGYRRPALVLEEEMMARTEGGFLAEYAIWKRMHPTSHFETMTVLSIPQAKTTREIEALQTELRQQEIDVIVGTDFTQYFLKTIGLTSPRDLAFAHLDLMHADGLTSGVSIERGAIGGIAVELLTGMLNRNQRGLPSYPCHTAIQPIWRDGKTAPGIKTKRKS
jgi:LacI family transcriptional regulator